MTLVQTTDVQCKHVIYLVRGVVDGKYVQQPVCAHISRKKYHPTMCLSSQSVIGVDCHRHRMTPEELQMRDTHNGM